MATIAENIQTIATATADIKDAILEKGVTLTGDITTYGDAIRGMGGAPEPIRNINFFDFEGTVIKSFDTLSEMNTFGWNNIVPPQHEGLTFAGWNMVYDEAIESLNACKKLDIGATYTIDSGDYDSATRFHIHVNDLYNKTVTINIPMPKWVVDWGDGSPVETRYTGAKQSISHKYDSQGDYIITVYSPLSNEAHIQSSITGAATLWRLDLGPNFVFTLDIGEFSSNKALEEVMVSADVSRSIEGIFKDCTALKALVLRNNASTSIVEGCTALKTLVTAATYINDKVFKGCTNLERVVLLQSVSMINSEAFAGTRIQSVIIPRSVRTIHARAFADNPKLIEVDCTVPSRNGSVYSLRDATVFENCPNVKIIVPDDMVETYKTATNWSNYADKIIGVNVYKAQIENM